MTLQEAIETIKIAQAEVEWEYPMDYADAFDEAIKALEKQMPDTPNIAFYRANCRKNPRRSCTKCNTLLTSVGANYCVYCGQKLDWSKEGEEKCQSEH
jgi:hypothetical protein